MVVAPGDNVSIATECAVTRAAANVVVLPYDVDGPYSTCESEATAVFQVMLAVLPAVLTRAPLIQVEEEDPEAGANTTSTQ